jgi:PAS domain S-box-containing protein
MTTRPLGLGQVSCDGSAPDVARAQAGGTPQRVGAFHFYFDDQCWEWSEQVQRMHGYQPGTVTPTTELVLSHKHPDDRDQIAQTIDTIRRTGQPLSSRHRIVDTSGKVRLVVVVGDQLHDERGRIVGTQGFYIDTTPDEQEQQDLVTAQVATISENRAVIECGAHKRPTSNFASWPYDLWPLSAGRTCRPKVAATSTTHCSQRDRATSRIGLGGWHSLNPGAGGVRSMAFPRRWHRIAKVRFSAAPRTG